MLDRSHLPQSLGSNPNTYLQVAQLLDGPAYTAAQLLERLGRISPSPIPPGPVPNAEELVHDLRLLRILMPTGDGRWRRRPALDGAAPVLALRSCLLTLLLPRVDEGYWLPLLQMPDTAAHAVSAQNWPGGAALLQWYRAADLVRLTDDGRCFLHEHALAPVSVNHPLADVLNRFLQLVRNARRNDVVSSDSRLPALSVERLNAAIGELQRELLIDDLTLRRIYRALIAGQHVILSGPPGTGKTRLAQRLPTVFWRDQPQPLPSTDLDDAPDRPAAPDRQHHAGYAVELVTAGEDWGSHDLIGGIAPQLAAQGDSNRLQYEIRHGHLTRTVLLHYPTYDGRRVPLLRRRSPLQRDGRVYRGIWLVIDELNRAPVDAVFSTILTTLGAGDVPLRVPDEYGDTLLQLPPDFRIIGTLNSFDRHFVNQLSEALKRRFAFIEIEPPPRSAAVAEARSVLLQALQQLQQLGLIAGDGPGWPGVLQPPAGPDQPFVWQLPAAAAAFNGLQRLFAALRVYRRLGTAQYVSAALALFSGVIAGLDWPEALDAALADTVADQLQVLQRDEIQAIGLYLQSAADRHRFTARLNTLLAQLADGRYHAQCERLAAAHPLGAAQSPPDPLDATWLAEVFDLDEPLPLPAAGLLTRRLLSFLADHGL